MRIFVTGATGFIGSAVVGELSGAGHSVLGLARSDAAARALQAAGADALAGDVEDLESLRRGAASSEAVIHTAFIHEFSRWQENCETDRRAIEALGAALEGSQRPLIVTSGITAETPGRLRTEEDPAAPSAVSPRSASEEAALSVAARGVRTSVVRLPQVHDPEKQGLVTYLIAVARAKGVSAYVGDGANRWPAAHRLDVAHLYVLALERRAALARYHAVGEEGVPLRDIAEAIGRRINVPVKSIAAEESAAHFGPIGHFVVRDASSSSALTRTWLGWKPTGPGLIEDLDSGARFEPEADSSVRAVLAES